MPQDYLLCPKCNGRLCPKCGKGHVVQGFGLMGGGMGGYEFCDADNCHYFEKEQEPKEE